MHRLDLSLYSHLNRVRTHVISKGKIPFTGKILPRGGLNLGLCIRQDSEPNTLPTSYSDPQKHPSLRYTCMLLGLLSNQQANNNPQNINNNNNNNNNRIQRSYSRFFTISSQSRELSPTRTLKWPGRNRVQITCNTSSAYHVQVSCYVPLGTKGQLSY